MRLKHLYKFQVVFLIIFLSFFYGCDKNKDDPKFALTITVKSPDGLIPDLAFVYIYDNYDDAANIRDNYLDSGHTDSDGKTTFSGLEPIVYYVIALCMNDSGRQYGGALTTSKLSKDSEYTISTKYVD